MQKMFTTQLTGLFQTMMEKEKFQIEDGARLLAQAVVGEGNIYLKGFDEIEGIASEALKGAEPLQKSRKLTSLNHLTEVDRVFLFTRFSTDRDAVILANQLIEKNIPFVAISGIQKDTENSLQYLADIHINTHLDKPLLPSEIGTRVGFPSLLVALYIYHSVKFLIDEMIIDYE